MKVILLGVLGLVLPVSLVAGTEWSLGAAAGYVKTDSSREDDFFAEDGTAWEVSLQAALNPRHALRLSYSSWNIDVGNAANPAAGDKGITSIVGDYLLGNVQGDFQYYGLLGAGRSRADIANGDHTEYNLVNAGFGLQHAFAKAWSWAAELKWRRSYDDVSVAGTDDFDDWSLSVGLRYGFDKATEAGPSGSAEPPSRDLANIKMGYPNVYQTAEPTAMPVATAPAAQPNEAQCAGHRYTVYFDDGSAMLRPNEQAALKQLAADLADCPDATVVVFGYTGPKASKSTAAWLSESRSNKVADYLCANGVDCEESPIFRRPKGSVNFKLGDKPDDIHVLSLRAEIWLALPLR
jgi:outer membrane protein OmpA-like peptidoglycan-associated protein